MALTTLPCATALACDSAHALVSVHSRDLAGSARPHRRSMRWHISFFASGECGRQWNRRNDGSSVQHLAGGKGTGTELSRISQKY
jgi:hypothetical protein